MKKLLTALLCLALCISFPACAGNASESSSQPPSSQLEGTVTESTISDNIQSALDAKEAEERLKQEHFANYRAPSEAGYTYVWDETLNNIYAPSKAYPMGDPQPGEDPIHIIPRAENSSGTAYTAEKPFYGKGFDFLCLGGDVMGYKVAAVQAIAKEEWESEGFLYTTSKKDYTKVDLSPHIIREDEDYVLLDITELILGAPFEEYLLEKKADSPEISYSWVLEPAEYLHGHLDEIIQKK